MRATLRNDSTALAKLAYKSVSALWIMVASVSVCRQMYRMISIRGSAKQTHLREQMSKADANSLFSAILSITLVLSSRSLSGAVTSVQNESATLDVDDDSEHSDDNEADDELPLAKCPSEHLLLPSKCGVFGPLQVATACEPLRVLPVGGSLLVLLSIVVACCVRVKSLVVSSSVCLLLRFSPDPSPLAASLTAATSSEPSSLSLCG